MNVRLTGSSRECSEMLAVLMEHLAVTRVDGPYPNRDSSRLVRLYLEAHPIQTPTANEGRR
jgi:hypothetical protein